MIKSISVLVCGVALSVAAYYGIKAIVKKNRDKTDGAASS